MLGSIQQDPQQRHFVVVSGSITFIPGQHWGVQHETQEHQHQAWQRSHHLAYTPLEVRGVAVLGP